MRKKGFLIYISIAVALCLFTVFILNKGKLLEIGCNTHSLDAANSAPVTQFTTALCNNISAPVPLLLAQIAVILITGRLLGFLCTKVGQPRVMGEIIAGIALGPSLAGHYFPAITTALFPVRSLPNLQFLGQMGIILFMFITGMELDLAALKHKTKHAVLISQASILVPFTLGVGLAWFIYRTVASPGVPFFAFALFTGIAMSITAFPVLARICQERGISNTPLGVLAITCAAADDIAAWCILAVVIAIIKALSVTAFLYSMLLILAYLLVMLKVVRPLLNYYRRQQIQKGHKGIPIAASVIMLILSAYTAEVIGIHALFGAFLAGAILPGDSAFRGVLIERLKDVTLFLLLPLFFVFSGLRTQIGLLDTGMLWLVCGAIVLVAVSGKFLGSALTARWVGQSWKDSLSIGALMNTRGLMELIVLNIGYDLGVITRQLFAIMVIMAVATTLMTGPALNLINKYAEKY